MLPTPRKRIAVIGQFLRRSNECIVKSIARLLLYIINLVMLLLVTFVVKMLIGSLVTILGN